MAKAMGSGWIAVLVVFGLLVGCGGAKSTEGGQSVVTVTVQAGDTTTDAFSDAPESEDEFSEETTTEETPSGDLYSIGESAQDDGLVFKVLSLEEVSQIEVGQYAYPSRPIQPTRGAKLVLATVLWKNETNESVDNFCGGAGAKLLDEEDRNFDPIDRQIDIRRNTICSKEVQPGFKVKQYLAFEMPNDSQIGGLAVWNSAAEEDYFGDTYVVFVP